MTSTHTLRASRVVVAGALAALALVAGAAQARSHLGYTVGQGDEHVITAGMTAEQVTQAIGRPAGMHSYASSVGPVWTYEVLTDSQSVFEVDFGSDGKVASAEEHPI